MRHNLKNYALCIMHCALTAQAAEWNTPGAGNPVIPGYFADPTIRKFGDTYYIYATTDGTGNGYGPAQVWVSKDFVNWKNVLMNWPTTEVVWAPDVVEQPDGTYRYYYCTPCNVHVGESSSPIGPWKNRLGESDAVLVPDRFVHNAITLDPQLFRDDDGSEYLYFGTWGIYKGFGCGVARLSADGKSFTDKKLIENTEITDFFEAPYVFKKDGVYYFTYSSGSCHDDTYRVQYAVSKTGPMGPYEYKGCILKTNADGTIHGPGHHSIFIDGDDYYIIYHRHNNPHSIHGFHRQLCIEKMEFAPNGDIKPITPTHEGVIPSSMLTASKSQLTNLAFGAKATASSTYSDWFKPEYATDDNNGTLWRAADVASVSDAWLEIDLGKATAFNTIFTQFEYATFFYQYKIETSLDGKAWTTFADRTANTTQGSPMIDTPKGNRYKTVNARYIRINIYETQKNGHFPAIWNVKVYNATKRNDPIKLFPDVKMDEKAIVAGYPWIHRREVEQGVKDTGKRMLFGIDAEEMGVGGEVQGVPIVEKMGKAALEFDGKHTIKVDTADLKQLTYNAPYTLTAWVNNPEVGDIETIANLMPAYSDMATMILRNGLNAGEGVMAHYGWFENYGAKQAVEAGRWQHWAVTFDGFNERLYCDGRLISEKNLFLMLRPGEPILIGSDMRGDFPFTGYLSSIKLYNYAFTADEVKAAATPSKEKKIYTPKDLKGNDFTNAESQWSYERMDSTENIVIFWEKGFGNDLSKAPALDGNDMTVDLDNLKEKLEADYRFFRDTLQFVRRGSKSEHYKMMVMLNYSLEGTAYGGDYDQMIGALWLAPNRVKDKQLNCIAHELGHSFQLQLTADGDGIGWGGCGFYEMTSQWMLWQVNPLWMDDENYHWQAFRKQFHKAFLSIDNIYHSPFVLEYWGMRYGKPFIAELFRQGLEGEDPAVTYKKLIEMTQDEFCDDMFHASAMMVNLDYPRVWQETRRHALQLSTPMTEGGDGWMSPAEGFAPENYGFNVVEVPIAGGKTSVEARFEGLDALDATAEQAAKAGWRYGFVGVTADGKTVYGTPSSAKKGKASLEWDKATDMAHAYLVVMGAPTEHWVLPEQGVCPKWNYRVNVVL